jgi:methyl-accepting chemotaxis protein
VSHAAETIRSSSERVSSGAAQQAAAIDQVSRKIAQLGQRSLEIGRIVDLVEEIARETNLLALNSSIEATRTSGGSRGFALVAEEVRKLAARAQTATREIAAFLETIQEATTEAGAAMSEIRAVTRRTVEEAAQEYGLAEEVVAAARTLEEAIARFRVEKADDDTTRERLRAIERQREELTQALVRLDAEELQLGGRGGE